MAQRREEIESFIRKIVARIEAAEARGTITPEAIAAHFNETGVKTRKGRGWTAATLRKFLASPGAQRYRMMNALDIYEATDDDLPDILAVIRAAFDSDVEASLTRALLTDPSAEPRLSLLAAVNGRAVGHILFTSAVIEDVTPSVPASLLCPLSVLPEAQRRGVGGKLIETGLRSLTDAETALVFVFGDPAYYCRHGFEPAAARGLPAPYPIPREHADAWMVRSLRGGIIDSSRGTVRCADALDDPAFWLV